jgi:hypothetical protein
MPEDDNSKPAPRLEHMDPVFESFLSAADGQQSEDQLGDLLGRHATPIVRRIVGYRLGTASGDADDVASQVMLQLVLRLRRERTETDLGAIDSFDSYVATAAHHACDHYIRAKYPLRWRLRNRLRYALEHDRRFALWRTPGGTLICGHAAWQSRPAVPPPAAGRIATPQRQEIPALLRTLFDAVDGPIEFTALVDTIADAWGVPLSQHDAGPVLEDVADRQPRADDVLEQHAGLSAVWAQIRELPLRQRHALLLNLKGDAITAFLVTGAASLRVIAAALELPIDELAALWNDLPLSDNVIAGRLDCTRQQVINFRMAARKRLANRLPSQANIDRGRAL